MNVKIYENETVDDLQLNGLSIIQKKEGSFKFGTDAVLLSAFASGAASERTLDLCSGSGIVPILMSAKCRTPEFHAIELLPSMADMAERSVMMNGLGDRIKIVCADLRDALSLYEKRSFNCITCNPPYIRSGAGILNMHDEKITARHEISCTLEDIASVSSKLLSHNGRFFAVHRPSRLADLIYLMRKYEVEPKRIRFVHNTPSHPPVLFLIEGLYKGNSDIKVLPPLILYNEKGEESAELKKIYGREENI